MRYDTRYRYSGSSYSGYFPAGVKWLLIANISLFVIYFFTARTEYGDIFRIFALSPRAVLGHLAVWQLVTYMFLHSPAGFSHILFNMLALWMFGATLERDWGTKRFLTFYFVCGVGAGICDILANLMFGSLDVRTIGASGAIYGLLLAFGMLYPDTTVLFSFLFPMKAKYMVMIVGAIAFLSSFDGSSSGVSHVAHLGGMLWGYLYIKFALRRSYAAATPGGGFSIKDLRARYKQWQIQRARRKFQVYMKKHGSGRGPFVN